MMVSALIERELSAETFPIRDGVFVAVVGPSGAGKDTVIGYARNHFADETRLEFVRRVITRPSDAASEDHDTLADAAFAEAEADGAFAISWEAHGLRYGIPADVDWSVANGRVAVANVSRAIIPSLRERYANLAVVEITASP
ncbi:phosphonate metabolism protein/1,5-bisphosphokinase (PRPP-forming) PhnN, partial [Mesorhizobium sp. M7A.F.Ca.US.003.02.1.1]